MDGLVDGWGDGQPWIIAWVEEGIYTRVYTMNEKTKIKLLYELNEVAHEGPHKSSLPSPTLSKDYNMFLSAPPGSVAGLGKHL